MTTMESAVVAKVNYILAPERDQEWLAFRESLQDSALLEAPSDSYFLNMRAAYMQLLGGAMMRALGGPAALTENPALVMRLDEAIDQSLSANAFSARISELESCYNSAYGSSPIKGISAMVQEFNRIVTNQRISSRACGILVEHFTAVWVSIIQEFCRLTGKSAIALPRGTGCLLAIVSAMGAGICAAMAVAISAR